MLREGKYYRLKTYGELKNTKGVKIDDYDSWGAYYDGFNCGAFMFNDIDKAYNNRILCENIYNKCGDTKILESFEVYTTHGNAYYLQEWMLVLINHSHLMETE